MGLRDRIVEITYRLRDGFTGYAGKVAGAFKQVDDAADKSAGTMGRFSKGARRAGRIAASAFKRTLSVLGLLGATAAALTFSRSIRELDELAKTAEKLGVAVGDLDALRYAADRSGVDVNTLETSLQRLTRRTAEAAQGTGEAASALGELGLDAQELAKLSPDRQLLLIADAMQDIGNQGDKIRLAFKLFDSGGVELLKLTKDGAEGVRKLMAEVYATGRAVSEEQAKAASDAADQWTRLWDRVGRVKNQVLGGIARGGNNLIDSIFGTPATLDEAVEKTRSSLHKVQGYYDDFLKRAGPADAHGVELLEDRITALKENLEKLTALQQELDPGNGLEQQRREQQAEERAHNRAMFQLRKEGTENLKNSQKERQTAYKAHLAQLRQYKEDAKAIAKEFSDFVDEIQQGQQSTPDLIDTGKIGLDARTALNRGDYQAALNLARKAKDAIGQMKEAGTESHVVLLGLARDAERTANAAAQARVKEAQAQAEAQKKVLDEVAQRIKDLPKAELKFDEGGLRVELKRIQQMMNENPLIQPVQLQRNGSADIRWMRDTLNRAERGNI